MTDLDFQPDCVCEQRITLNKGRSRTLQFTLSTVVDLTNVKLKMTVKKEVDDDDDDAVITLASDNNGGSDSQAKVTDLVERVIEFYLVPANTLSVDYGDYWIDAALQLSGGGDYQLMENSTLILTQPVTQNVVTPP